jgi:hypothetical protein
MQEALVDFYNKVAYNEHIDGDDEEDEVEFVILNTRILMQDLLL